MATSNNSRDVKMTLSVETLGADGIKQLQTSVSQLAKQGGDAAPEFQKLADEIGRLGEQASALQSFQALSDETAALSLRQAQAAATAGELKTKLDLLSAETSTAAAAQATVAAELGKAENAARATRDALAVLTAQTSEAKKADDGYAETVSKLKLVKVEQRAEIERLSSAMTAANADVKTAEAAEAKLANAYRAASAAAELANTATRANATAVADAANAALDLGVTTDNVAAAQAELVQGLNKSGQAAQDLEANVKRLADRQRELDEIRAFDKQAEAARRLVTAGEYADLFDEALQRLAATEREVKAQTAEDKWQKEAFALVEAAEATKKLSRETELLAAVERELAAQAVFAQQAADAAKLVQASEYVRDFENALQNLSAAEKASADSTAADKWQKEAFALVEAAEAAKKLTHETEVLTAAERELAAQAAFEKQADDARKLLQAGEYVNFWTAELAKAETQTQQTAAAAQASSQRISDAFRTLGVRSAEELQTEIAQVRAAMETVGATSSATGSTLSGAFNAGTARVKDLERELRSLNGELTVGDKAAKLFAGSMGQIAAGNLIADGVGYLVNKVKELGRAFLEAVVQGDQMRRGLTAIYKDAEVAARQIDFLRKSSSESGVAFGQLSGEFVKFSASMKSANIPLEQSNALFKAVTAASASLGLGTEATAGALNALGQMASKGCHAPGTLIRLFDGGTKPVETVAVGEYLMSPDGTQRKVLALAAGREEMHLIRPDIGEPFVVNTSHKLRLVLPNSTIETVMLRDYISGLTGLRGKLSLHAMPIGFSVEPIGEGDYFGFVLDGDHLYLDAQGFEHHNTVSMEELRQQLGDRLPGAMGLTAKGLGITEGELVKLVETGQLATRDFIVPFTTALKTMQGEVDGLVPAFDRLKSTMTEMAQGVGDAGGVTFLTGALKVLGGVVGTVALGLSQMVEGLFLVGAGVVATAAALAGDTKAWDYFNDQVAKSGVRLDNQVASLKNFLAPSAAAADATGKHAVAMTAHTAEVVKSIAATDGLSASQKLAALSTALAADKTLDASAKIVQYNVASTALLAQQEAQTVSFEKLAKAAKQQGDTMIEMARLTGDSTLIHAASTAAAEIHLAALTKVSESQLIETQILIAQKAELIASKEQRKLTSEDIKLQTDALDKLIAKSTADTEASKQATEQAKLQVFERKLATEALKDHSGAIAELKVKMDDSAKSLDLVILLEKLGLKSSTDVTAARQDLTRATVLYKDSLNDMITKTEMANKVKSADMQLSIAQADASGKHYLSLAAEARALGDTAMATHYEVSAKEAQIKTMQLKLQLDKLQQDAALLEIDLKRKTVTGSEEEKKIKLQLLDIETQMIKIKQAGNQAALDAIAGIQRETDALRTGINVRKESTDGINTDTGARNTNTGAIDAQTSALEAQNAAQERATAAKQKAKDLDYESRGLDKDGFIKRTEAKTYAYETKASIYKQMVSNGLTETQALRLSDEFGREARADGGGTWTQALADQMNGFLRTNAEGRAKLELEAGTTGVVQSGTAPKAATNSTTTVNVNINGRSTPVNVASQADANALTSILRQLESASGTAS